MIVTLPVLFPGRNDDARQVWMREDRMIPRPIVIDDLRIDPAPNVIVQRVSFQSCHVLADEPWCIVWATLEIPDGLIAMPFRTAHPKLIARKEPPGERDKIFNERAARIKAKMSGTATVEQVAAMHAARVADCEPAE